MTSHPFSSLLHSPCCIFLLPRYWPPYADASTAWRAMILPPTPLFPFEPYFRSFCQPKPPFSHVSSVVPCTSSMGQQYPSFPFLFFFLPPHVSPLWLTLILASHKLPFFIFSCYLDLRDCNVAFFFPPPCAIWRIGHPLTRGLAHTHFFFTIYLNGMLHLNSLLLWVFSPRRLELFSFFTEFGNPIKPTYHSTAPCPSFFVPI